jgi:hypothetical protein
VPRSAEGLSTQPSPSQPSSPWATAAFFPLADLTIVCGVAYGLVFAIVTWVSIVVESAPAQQTS